MLDYDGFLRAALDRVRNDIPGVSVDIRPVEKLQGGSYTGLSVMPEVTNTAVVLNLMPAYEQYRRDESRLDVLLGSISQNAGQLSSSVPSYASSSLLDYKEAKDLLTMQVLPLGPNREMLENVPHKTVGDLAVVYRLELPDTGSGPATALVTGTMLNEYGISADRLHADALAAQVRKHPPVLRNMSEVMQELSGGAMEFPESPLWVATVEGGVNGASVVQMPSFLEEAAVRLGGNYYVLPSSVHEVLFLRDDGSFRREELENMVHGVNTEEVSAADFLSDNIYHYDSEAHIFEQAAAFESRIAEAPGIYGSQQDRDMLHVLLVEPGRHPRPVDIAPGLASLQDAVQGYIEVVYPFEDKAGLIVNEEGKLEGLPLNRALRDEDGEIVDVVAGPFLVVGLTEDGFGSLSPEQMEKYEAHFHQPETFLRMGKGILALPIPDDTVNRIEERASARSVPDRSDPVKPRDLTL